MKIQQHQDNYKQWLTEAEIEGTLKEARSCYKRRREEARESRCQVSKRIRIFWIYRRDELGEEGPEGQGVHPLLEAKLRATKITYFIQVRGSSTPTEVKRITNNDKRVNKKTSNLNDEGRPPNYK